MCWLALYRLPESRQITVSRCFQAHQIVASSTDKRVFEEVDHTEEYGQTNIGLTAFLLSVFIITIIYVVRYIRSKRAAAAAIVPAIEYQPPVDPITRSVRAPPASIVVPIEDPITPPRSPRVPVLLTNVTNASDNGGRVTNTFRRFSVRWPNVPESVR